MEKHTVSASLTDNTKYMNRALPVKKSFDIIERNLIIGGQNSAFYFIDGFTKDETMLKLMDSFLNISADDMPEDATSFSTSCIPYVEVDILGDFDSIFKNLLSGVTCLFIDGYEAAIAIDCRTYPARGVSEPEKDKVMRGSRDGFVETLVFNTALIRRRIRDPKLIMEILTAGESSHTDIAMCYMEGRADKKLIEKIRKSAELNTAILDEVARQIHVGMSTQEIDDIVYRFTKEHGGIPAPLNYQGFPKSVCTSINNEICHGIPDENIILEEGDIINVDVSTILDGYFSDASRMFMIGKVSERAEKLVRVTQECVELGLAQAKPWNHLGDIADAINSHAKANGYSVVEEIGGHGVGLEFHEEPWVSYVTPKGSEMLLVPGMIFTIEPMINEGSPEFFVDEDNDWTVYTEDDGLSAQVEYMVRITDDGAVVMTK